MEKNKKNQLPFQKGNYILLISGILLLFIGFFVMTLDNEPYGFGFLGITLGPIILIIGFVVEFFAIFYSPKKSDDNS